MGVGYRWGRIFRNPLEPALALGPPGLVKARSADTSCTRKSLQKHQPVLGGEEDGLLSCGAGDGWGAGSCRPGATSPLGALVVPPGSLLRAAPSPVLRLQEGLA